MNYRQMAESPVGLFVFKTAFVLFSLARMASTNFSDEKQRKNKVQPYRENVDSDVDITTLK